MGQRLALLIATYEYRDTGLRRLEAPAADVEALAAVLGDPNISGFQVSTLVNQPNHVVGEAIGDFYRGQRRDDLALLYFTGHGLKDEDGHLYLAMENTRRDNLAFTALPTEQLHRAMQASRSRQVVLILDCCYSGAFPAGRTAKSDTEVHALEGLQARGRTVLAASDAMQYSFEGERLDGVGARSVFTRHLVEGLREGNADLDHDGQIALDELYAYVYDRVVEEMPQQRPKKIDNVEGRTIIARNMNWRPPDHLRHSLKSPIASDRHAALDGLEHLCRIGSDAVRGYALTELRRLTEDDSRQVSTAAKARLNTLDPSWGAEQREREERARREREAEFLRNAAEQAQREREELARKQAAEHAQRVAEEHARREANEQAARRERDQRAQWEAQQGAAWEAEQQAQRERERPTRTNELAIASLVLGILGVFMLFPAAAICGWLALHQIKARGDAGRGLAIAGLVLSALWLLVYIWIFVSPS
ncbi:caspase, EACC1-associated type [Pseudonocardia acaciae]|uniref:caspase, EACC1-associated type n=1 Tax=Pseudonocardia acaciae TaxID=551276 RepID=UPI00068594C3|nr:caspase family protein [Pseudonocardia acaciae]